MPSPRVRLARGPRLTRPPSERDPGIGFGRSVWPHRRVAGRTGQPARRRALARFPARGCRAARGLL